MRKKCLITLAAIAVLTAQCVHATTNITGVTGSNGTYNINPEKASQNVAYRKYSNFKLDQGDIANLNFNNREAFINLVDNQVNIGGILNSVDANGNFFNGHAIFITPNGMVVGDQGVLNVGRLSVATPSSTKYNSLVSDYGNDTYTEINKVSELKKDGNGAITVNGYIFTTKGADLSGSAINIPGKVVNGIATADRATLTNVDAAQTLFESLVNVKTLGGSTKKSTNLGSNGNDLIIRNSNKSGAKVNITGTVANIDKSHKLYIINNGQGGMTLGGDATIGAQGDIAVSNHNGAFTANAVMDTPQKLTVSNVNKNNQTVGAMNFDTAFGANGKIISIVNTDGDSLTFDGLAVSQEATYLRNKKGAMTINGNVGATAGKTSIYNYGTKLTTAGTINNTGGNLLIRNNGTGDLDLGGTVTNTGGIAAISNTNGGDLNVKANAKITNTGNLGIVNRSSAGGLTVASSAVIKNNNGVTKVVNHGSGGETMNGTVNGNGATYIYNKGGKLTVNGTVTSGSNLYVFNKGNSTGLEIGDNAVITTAAGSLAIKNNGAATGNDGLTIGAATITNNGSGQTAINNYTSGNMTLASGSKINTKNTLAIINRNKGGQMDVFSQIVNTGTGSDLKTPVTNIKQNGTGAMNVGGTLTNAGTAHVVANKGKLTLSQQVTNAAPYYAVARENATGLETTADFSATGSGQVLIKNVSGTNGFTHRGTINITNGQAAIVNNKGTLDVYGTVKSTGGRAIVRNSGAGVNLKSGSLVESNAYTRVINTGTQAATMNGTVKKPSSQTDSVLHEKLSQ